MTEPSKYKSVDAMLEDFAKEEREHPIYLWFYRKFWQLIRLPGEIKLALVAFIQRGKRGWAVSDTWGLGSYLSEVIYGSLVHLNKHKHGYPSTLDPMTKDYGFNQKRWDFILNEMIWAFEIAREIGDTVYYLPTKDWSQKTYNIYVDIAKKQTNYPDAPKHRVLTKAESKRYEQGMKYFIEYLPSLWD